MTPARDRRRAVGVAAVLALAAAATVAGVGSTSAAYTDRARATTEVFEVPTTQFVPQQTRAGKTAIALQDDGSMAIWGFRGRGLAGTGEQTVASQATISMTTLPSDGHPDGRRRAVQVAGVARDGLEVNQIAFDTGVSGMAALSDDGLVYTWGGTQQLGMMGRSDDVTPFTRPGRVEIPGRVVHLISSNHAFLVLTESGDVYQWGWNGEPVTWTTAGNPPGGPDLLPRHVLSGVHSIHSGAWSFWAVRGDTVPEDPATGVLWWGWLGTSGAHQSRPISDPSGDGHAVNARSFVAEPRRSEWGSQHTTSGCGTVGVVAGSPEDECGLQQLAGLRYGNVARLRDGSVYTWGKSFGWMQGTTVAALHDVPTEVELPAGVRAAHVAHHTETVYIHGDDQHVYMYGRQDWGGGVNPATGATSTTNYRTPVRLDFLGPVEHIGGFSFTATVVRPDGALLLWGGGEWPGGRGNVNRVVRDTFATTSIPTTLRPVTELVMPGSGRSTS